MEASGTVKTLIIRVRGFKNQVFGYVRFVLIFGTILEVTLELKMHSKSHCDSLWAPSVGIFSPIWANRKKHENSGPRGGLKSDLGGMGTTGVGRW